MSGYNAGKKYERHAQRHAADFDFTQTHAHTYYNRIQQYDVRDGIGVRQQLYKPIVHVSKFFIVFRFKFGQR